MLHRETGGLLLLYPNCFHQMTLQSEAPVFECEMCHSHQTNVDYAKMGLRSMNYFGQVLSQELVTPEIER